MSISLVTTGQSILVPMFCRIMIESLSLMMEMSRNFPFRREADGEVEALVPLVQLKLLKFTKQLTLGILPERKTTSAQGIFGRELPCPLLTILPSAAAEHPEPGRKMAPCSPLLRTWRPCQTGLERQFSRKRTWLLERILR